MEQHNAMVFDADTVALPDGREETKVCTHYKFSTFVHPSPEKYTQIRYFLALVTRHRYWNLSCIS